MRISDWSSDVCSSDLVIGKLPLPGDPVGGPMHRVPSLQWQTWLRLAFVPAGKDWRALSDYRVVDGMLADYGFVPERALRDHQLGVRSEERRGGKECGSTCRCRGSPHP